MVFGAKLYGSWGYYHEIWHDEAHEDVFWSSEKILIFFQVLLLFLKLKM